MILETTVKNESYEAKIKVLAGLFSLQKLWGESFLGLPALGKCRHSFSVQSLPLLLRGYLFYLKYPSQFSSVVQSCLTLCDPMNHSTPGLPVHHQLPEFTQTHVRWVGDAIQPPRPLSSLSPPAPNPSQHQGLFQWVNSLHEVAKVLEFQLQHLSFQQTPRTDLL